MQNIGVLGTIPLRWPESTTCLGFGGSPQKKRIQNQESQSTGCFSVPSSGGDKGTTSSKVGTPSKVTGSVLPFLQVKHEGLQDLGYELHDRRNSTSIRAKHGIWSNRTTPRTGPAPSVVGTG